MRLFDRKFKKFWRLYVAQSLLAMLTILAIVLTLNSVEQTALIASLGASVFYAYCIPHSLACRPRYMLGGYVIGTIIGCSLSLLADLIVTTMGGDYQTIHIIFGAIATGLTIFLMVTTDTEHPPAIALSLGYVLNEWDLGTVAVILAGISIICIVRAVLRPKLINLL